MVNELALFAGAGGGILGGYLLGWRTVCAVEYDPYAASVLVARQNDGCLPPFPVWDDVRTFDGRPWRGIVDVVSGGFPCQDISIAGAGKGIDGERSGLWREMARIIREVGPRYVLVENSPALTFRGLGRVLADLAEMGYDARWGVLGAVHAGAPHKRERIWIVAYADGFREPQSQGSERGKRRRTGNARETFPDTVRERLERLQQARAEARAAHRSSHGSDSGWWATEPALGRVAHGVAHRVDRIRAAGNGQVPAVVRLAWETLKGLVAADETQRLINAESSES